MAHDSEGNVVAAGRKSRAISTPLRRKLKERDAYMCRFPGCTNRFTDGHHIKHWAHGGETTLENLVSLCRMHHRFVHEFGFAVRRDADGMLVFRDAQGKAIANKPQAVCASGVGLVEGLTEAAVLSPMPRCTGRAIDYGYVISALRG